MARNLRLGERVKRVGASYERIGSEEEPTAEWDIAKCPTGQVVGIYNGGKAMPASVLVQPDPEGGFGMFIVPVGQLERIKNKPENLVEVLQDTFRQVGTAEAERSREAEPVEELVLFAIRDDLLGLPAEGEEDESG